MYIEKDYLIKKIDEWCELKGFDLTYKEKDFLSSQVSRALDQDRLLTFDEFSELLDHNEQLDQYTNIDFNDEIVSIEEYGEIDTIDFNVTGNHLFFADGVLTHNSATNNVDDADNSNVSDSMGTVMTADFMMFLLQNEEMKEKKEIVCKITKNRFAGITDTWLMNIDYEHMRFHDMIVQSPVSALDVLTEDSKLPAIDDFGIITPDKQQNAEEFAKSEIKAIASEDMQKVINADKHKDDPFDSDLQNLYDELGL